MDIWVGGQMDDGQQDVFVKWIHRWIDGQMGMRMDKCVYGTGYVHVDK